MDFKTPSLHGSLSGKIALVTGSSYGIGRGIAIELASKGASVIVNGRRQEQIDITVDRIKKIGGKAVGKILDVCDKEMIDTFFSGYVKSLGGLDIFVNNAGVTKVCDFIDNTADDIEWICRTNLLGAVFCVQNAAKLMISQGRGGSIVIVTSVNALAPLPTQTFYSGTKAALEAIMRGIAVELREHNIRVNTVAPGAVWSGMNEGIGVDPEDMKKFAKRHIPLKRIGDPEDIAKAVAFAASDDASYMTGSTMLVDGGLMLRQN
jgi:NAD(P)-dependent dehydrogenase (short-subunit alcohol dehydrogenase family)